VTTSKRIAALPNVPTVGESVPGYVAVGWHGFAGPKGLPAAIASFWNKEMNKAMEAEDMKKQWSVDALEPVGGPPENLVRTIERDVRTWKRVVKEAKIPMLN
jgi:tripartite-type tricarboxylate transporter receptor subunit TctC